MEVYRITTAKWGKSFQASGYAARWNSNGIYVLYTSEHRSLACLENLIHRSMNGNDFLFKIMTIHIPDHIPGNEVKSSELRNNWHKTNEKAYTMCRKTGDSWARSGASLYLKVPSAIVPGEHNILVNTNHPGIQQVTILASENFVFDQRL